MMSSSWWCVIVTADDGGQTIVGPWRSEARAEGRASRLRGEELDAYVMPMEAP